MPNEDFEEAQYLSAQVEQARQRAVLAASDAGASRDDARAAEQQAREYARGVGQVVDGAETARDEAQAAADRAEAPTDSMVATLATNPVSLTRAAVDQATGDMITTEGSTTQTAGDARWVTQTGADIIVASEIERTGSETQVSGDNRWVTNEGADNTVAEALGKQQSQSATAMLGVIASEAPTAEGLIPSAEKARLFGSVPIGDRDLNSLTDLGEFHQNYVSFVSSERHYPWYGTNVRVSNKPIGDGVLGQYAHAPLRREKKFRYRSAAGVWSAWDAEVSPDATPEFFGKEQRPYPVVLTNTTKFKKHPTFALPVLTRSGNSMELSGVVRVAADGAGASFTSVFELPPDALPFNGTTRYFPIRGNGGKSGTLYISTLGNVQIFDMPGMLADESVFLCVTWTVAPAPPYSFERICNRMINGTDYTRAIDANGHWLNVNAVHGGETEQGTSEIAQAIRAATGSSWYEWDIMKTSVLGSTAFDAAHEVNGDYKGVKFDDPALVDLIRSSDDCLAFHGAADGTGETGNGRPPGELTCLGGDNKVLRELIGAHLRAAGFPALDDPAQFPTLSGAGPRQPHNSAKNQGVQIEISTTQRKAFFAGGDTSRANRVNTTQAFADYRDAILSALAEYKA